VEHGAHFLILYYPPLIAREAAREERSGSAYTCGGAVLGAVLDTLADPGLCKGFNHSSFRF
jgi:hypothetical protein